MIGFKEALEKVKEEKEIKDAVEEGYYLNAGIGVMDMKKGQLKRWIITFYNPDKEEVVQGIMKGEDEFNFKESAEPMDPSTKEINLDKVKLTAKEAVDKAKEELEDGSPGVNQVLVNLKTKGKETWEVNMIGKSLELHRVDLDAETGEVKEKETKTLVKEGSEALPV